MILAGFHIHSLVEHICRFFLDATHESSKLSLFQHSLAAGSQGSASSVPCVIHAEVMEVETPPLKLPEGDPPLPGNLQDGHRISHTSHVSRMSSDGQYSSASFIEILKQIEAGGKRRCWQSCSLGPRAAVIESNLPVFPLFLCRNLILLAFGKGRFGAGVSTMKVEEFFILTMGWGPTST